ncbi:MAG: hypothetical protein JO102_03650, partial [Elusimicrobia bacterium]|nr:hypothetical protein [Elusimicrobiota bacterium]
WQRANGSREYQGEEHRVTFTDENGREVTGVAYTRMAATYDALARMREGKEDEVAQIRANQRSAINDVLAGRGAFGVGNTSDIFDQMNRTKPAAAFANFAKPELTMGLAPIQLIFTAIFSGKGLNDVNMDNITAISHMKAFQTDLDDLMRGSVDGKAFGAIDAIQRQGERMMSRKWELIIGALLPTDTLNGVDFANKPWESVGRILLFAGEMFATLLSGGTYGVAKGGYVATKAAIVAAKIASIAHKVAEITGLLKVVSLIAKIPGALRVAGLVGRFGEWLASGYRAGAYAYKTNSAVRGSARVLAAIGEYTGRRMFVNSVSNYMAVANEKGVNSKEAWAAARQVGVALITWQAFNIIRFVGSFVGGIASIGSRLASGIAGLIGFTGTAATTAARVLTAIGRVIGAFALGAGAQYVNEKLGGNSKVTWYQAGAAMVLAFLGLKGIGMLTQGAFRLVAWAFSMSGATLGTYAGRLAFTIVRLGKAYSDSSGLAALGLAARWTGAVALRLGVQSLQGLGYIVRYGGAGAIASIVYNDFKNLSNNENFFHNVEKSALQGAFLGIMVGGGLAAMSRWVGTANNITNAGRTAFEAERTSAAIGMGLWEVAFNSAEYNGDWWNPMTWMSGISESLKGAGLIEDTPQERYSSILDMVASKFYGTYNNIFMLHPFFSFGRVGTNPLVAPVAGTAGLLRRAALALNDRALLSTGSTFKQAL